jgi:hypothetical protein
VDIPAKDLRPYWLGAQGLVLLAVVAVVPTRVVAAAGTVLLMPVMRVEDVARIIGITDVVMD